MDHVKDLKIDLLALLLLLLAFSVTILSLLLTGAKSYRALTERDARTQERRIEELYIGNRIRQAESPAALRLAVYDGTQCLEIESWIGEEAYLTRVYCFEGWIRELFTAADYAFSPMDGEKIAKAESLSFAEEGPMLKAVLEAEDGVSTLLFAWKEAAYEP